jgi:hypothetical protein
MATQRGKEPEGRIKRQRKSIRKEARDEFKTSPTRGRITERLFLCQNERDEVKVDIGKDGTRSKQQD